jgi:Head fiber protein.
MAGYYKIDNEDIEKVVAGLDRVAANQADSEASNVAELVADFNDLLAKLKAAGLMEPDA